MLKAVELLDRGQISGGVSPSLETFSAHLVD